MLRPTPLSVGPCPPPLGLVICCGVALTGESPRLNGSKAKKFQGASGEARGGGELGRQAYNCKRIQTHQNVAPIGVKLAGILHVNLKDGKPYTDGESNDDKGRKPPPIRCGSFSAL